MSTHAREHEELLAALSAGERRATEPEVARTLRECAACAREWAEVQETLAHLARVAAEERQALDELGSIRSAPGEERVLPTLARLAVGGSEAPRRPRRIGAWLAAALVLLAGAWLVLRSLERGAGPAPVWLGDGLHVEAPIGAVPGFARFSWTYTGPSADSFSLRVYASPRRPGDEPLLARERLKETTCTLTAQELERLPARIAWEVEALDAFRFVLPSGSGSAEAWLSP